MRQTMARIARHTGIPLMELLHHWEPRDLATLVEDLEEEHYRAGEPERRQKRQEARERVTALGLA